MKQEIKNFYYFDTKVRFFRNGKSYYFKFNNKKENVTI